MFKEKAFIPFIIILGVISYIFSSTIFAPLMGLYNFIFSNGGKLDDFQQQAMTKALDEVSKSSFDELHSDKFIAKVNDTEILCTVFCDPGPTYRYRHGIIPYHNPEDSAGFVYDDNKQLIGRKVVLKISPHGEKKFEEFTKSYLAAPNEEGYCVFEPFESYEERKKKIKEQQKAQQEMEKKRAEEQRKQDEENKIRRVQ